MRMLDVLLQEDVDAVLYQSDLQETLVHPVDHYAAQDMTVLSFLAYSFLLDSNYILTVQFFIRS